jgi:hypothetical protein
MKQLNNIAREYDLKISISKMGAIAFCGQNHIWHKLVIDNEIVE